MSLTPSEALVERLCTRSFLRLWSYANPRAAAGKELCDLLVVCDPDVVIFSVKEVGLKSRDNEDVDQAAAERWHKKAVEESAKQIYGAERRLASMTHVIRHDGSIALPLPTPERRRLYRIAVALGSEGKVLTRYGDFGKGFVHVLHEQSLERLLGELDTITDFVDFLRSKERLIQAGTYPLASGDDALLAIYLHRGRRFPDVTDVLIVEPNVWEDLIAKPEWMARKAEDRVSYVWDWLIELLSDEIGTDAKNATTPGADLEHVVRVMARECRFARRVLAQDFLELMCLAREGKVRARASVSPISRVGYVLLARDAGQSQELRESRRDELIARCLIVRGGLSESTSVVGIATEQDTSRGYTIDAALVEIPHWTPEHARRAEALRRESGYFASPIMRHQVVDEYPGTSPAADQERVTVELRPLGRTDMTETHPSGE